MTESAPLRRNAAPTVAATPARLPKTYTRVRRATRLDPTQTPLFSMAMIQRNSKSDFIYFYSWLVKVWKKFGTDSSRWSQGKFGWWPIISFKSKQIKQMNLRRTRQYKAKIHLKKYKTPPDILICIPSNMLSTADWTETSCFLVQTINKSLFIH